MERLQDWEYRALLELHEALAKEMLILEIESDLKRLRDQGKLTTNVLGRTAASYFKEIANLKSKEYGTLSELHEAISHLVFRGNVLKN